jgi:hypothetical protein
MAAVADNLITPKRRLPLLKATTTRATTTTSQPIIVTSMYRLLETLISKSQPAMLHQMVLRQALLAKFQCQVLQSSLPNKSDELCILNIQL